MVSWETVCAANTLILMHNHHCPLVPKVSGQEESFLDDEPEQEHPPEVRSLSMLPEKMKTSVPAGVFAVLCGRRTFSARNSCRRKGTPFERKNLHVRSKQMTCLPPWFARRGSHAMVPTPRVQVARATLRSLTLPPAPEEGASR